jgi:hypothetical protein
MGLSGPGAFAVYAKRYSDFPEPIVAKSRHIRLYLRQDLEAFLKRHPRIGRKARDSPAPPS